MNYKNPDCENLTLGEVKEKYIGAIVINQPGSIRILIKNIGIINNKIAFGKSGQLTHWLQYYQIEQTRLEIINSLKIII